MKIDKDMLIKHRFWVILGLAAPLSIIAIFILLIVVGAEIRRDLNNINSNLKSPSKLNPTAIVNDPAIEKWKQIRQDVERKEGEVWEAAYLKQEPLQTWPEAFESVFHFRDGLFAKEIKAEQATEKKDTKDPKEAKDPKETKDPKEAKEPKDKNPKDSKNPKESKEPAGKKDPPKEVGKENPKAAPKDVAPKDKGTGPAPDASSRVISGIITNVEKDWLKIRGDDNKDHTVYRSAKTSVNINGKDKSFYQDLQKGAKVTVTYERGKFFNDPLTDSEQNAYTSPGVYFSQIEPIYRQVQPVDTEGRGVVQLKGWFPKPPAAPGSGPELPPKKNGFLNFLSSEWQVNNVDISEEAWLAQQEVWINREIYRLIRLANDYVSKFERKGFEEKPAPDAVCEEKGRLHSFSNPYFTIDLKWEGGNILNVKIGNRLNRRQKLDVEFMVSTHKQQAEPEVFRIGGEPLAPAGVKGSEFETTVKLEPEGAPRTGIYSLEQVLTWETAAIKRIDGVLMGRGEGASVAGAGEIGAHSQRTLDLSLRPLEERKDLKPKKGEKPDPAAFEKALEAVVGPNGVGKQCYSEISAQTRRLPVAVTLIVDQDHIDRVYAAFGNSKLRFLITQALVNRYPGSMRPNFVDTPVAVVEQPKKEFDPDMIKKKNKDKFDPKNPNFDPKGGIRPPDGTKVDPKNPKGGKGGKADGSKKPPNVGKGSKFPDTMPGFFPPQIGKKPSSTGPGSSRPRITTPDDGTEANMEVIIYGIITLYQRYNPQLTAK